MTRIIDTYTVECAWTDPNANCTYDIHKAQEKLEERLNSHIVLYLHPTDFRHIYDYLNTVDHDFSSGLHVYGVEVLSRDSEVLGRGSMEGEFSSLLMEGL